MQFYIGLVFDPNSVHFHKIESFKKRYDGNYIFNPYIQLTLLPPFEIELKNFEFKKRFILDLSDLIEDHLLGLQGSNQIEFNGIDMSFGKRGILSLTPKIVSDYEYLKESLYYFLKDNGAKIKSSKEGNKNFLPIGRFDFEDQLMPIVEQAKLEFSSPFVLNTKQFCLFERNIYQWNLVETLFSFEQYQHTELVNQIWAN